MAQGHGDPFKEFLLGKGPKKADKSAGQLSKKGQAVKADLKSTVKKKTKDVERETQEQIDLAAGLGEDEKLTLENTRAVIDDSMKTRLQQLGAARLQDQRASGNSTLITDLEQDLAFQDQRQQAALASVSGSPMAQATAAASIAGSAGDNARAAAQARSSEVSSAEKQLLGSISTINDQDIAAQRIAQGVQIAQLQNAVAMQDKLTSGIARLEMGTREDLFRLQQAELDAANQLKIAEMNQPKDKGFLGGLLGLGGAVAGGLTTMTPAGAEAGAAAGGQLGRALEGAV